MSDNLISDEDGIYYARAWRRSYGRIDDAVKRDLFAWVYSKPPSKVCALLSTRLTDEESLALIASAIKFVEADAVPRVRCDR